MKELCEDTNHMMDQLIAVKHQVDGTQHTYIYIIFTSHIKMITTLLALLLQCIAQNFCTKFD